VRRRCLVVHPGALGDVLLAGPALRHLRDLGYRPTLAVLPWLVPLFEASGLVEAAADLESLALHRLFVEPPAPDALGTLATFDAVVCWMGAGDAAFRANLGRLGRPAVVARAVPPVGTGRHVSRHLIETLAPVGPLPVDVPFAPLRVSEAARTAARTWLAARGIGAGEALVLQPGAGNPAKIWPGFPTLARRLQDAGLRVVALAGPADHAVVRSLLAAGAVHEDALARDWGLPKIAALLSLAWAAVGNDSGPTHLAAAVGCPTVAIFGPTDPATWAPVGPRVEPVEGRGAGAAWPALDAVEAALRRVLTRGSRPVTATPMPFVTRDAWR
jgi:hypothetical protein